MHKSKLKFKIQKYLLVVFTLSFLFITKSLAIEFPIKNLGNCQNTRECHLYCEVPQNKPGCWAWQVYGNNSDVLGETDSTQLLSNLGITFPVSELGNCPSFSSCKNFCDQSINQTSCKVWAQKVGLTNKTILVEKAKIDLGCFSQEECKSFCEQDINQDKCKTFAQKYKIKNQNLNNLAQLGLTKLGCKSLIECKGFCVKPENKDKCSQFIQDIKSLLPQGIIKPITCTNTAECRDACSKNPLLCPNFPKPMINSATPSSVKSATPPAQLKNSILKQNNLHISSPSATEPG